MKFTRTLFAIILLLSVCSQGGFGQAVDVANLDKDVKAATRLSLGDAAPDFTCQATDGKPFTLSKNKGRVVLIYFFSSSNPACFAQMRYLESEVFQKLRKRDDFQMIALGRGHMREELVQIGGEHKLTFMLAADPGQEIYTRYFSKYVPRIVVVRWDGSVAYQAGGAGYEGVLRLQEVLARELAAARER